MFPWHELRDATQVPVLVDGAQSVGAIEVDATGADFYTVSAQKWLCGPDATGALYVADPESTARRGSSRTRRGDATTSPRATWAAEGRRRALRHRASRRRPRSPGLEAALTDLPAGRFERARELAERCRELLARAGPRRRHRAGPGDARLVSLAGRHSRRASAALYERGVIVRELPGTGLLRASVGWWNDGSDLERLVEGLEELAPLERASLRRPSSPAIGCSAATTFAMWSSRSSSRSSAPS